MADFIATNLTKTIGDKTVFREVDFMIHDLDRIGLLGLNGAGKTTLLNLISGVSGADGDRSPFDHPQNYKITYLTQEPDFDNQATILDTVLDDKLPQMAAIKLYEAALSRLAENPTSEANRSALSRAEDKMTALDAWNIEAEVKKVLSMLRLPDGARLIGDLSGGQKRRVQLAQALVNQSDLLLLDEPTNHLDVAVTVWLQNYLKSTRRTVLFVTHDRYFLDAVATRIFELEGAKLKEYQGNYQDYLTKKAEGEARDAASLHKAKQLYKSELAWIRKSPQARATKQEARISRFETLKKSLKTEKASGKLEMDIAAQRLGKKVIAFRDAAFAYPDRPIFKDFELTVQPHSRIGIIGDNGVGKSTLLNIISGELPLTAGSLEIGETVKIGYFSQEIRGLDGNEDKRLIRFLEEVASASRNTGGESLSIVDLLEQFLFPRSSHGTPISKLSGGEKKRLYLLKILLLEPNVLLLDEPTNDLDIETLTVLENFLKSFPGAVLTVSHDRYFQDKVSDELLAFENGEIHHYFGAYSDFLSVQLQSEDSTGEDNSSKAIGKSSAPTSKARLTYMEKKEWETIEADISELEEQITAIQDQMTANGSDSELLMALQVELEEKAATLEQKYERWEYLDERQTE